jgi:hypothetical protein
MAIIDPEQAALTAINEAIAALDYDCETVMSLATDILNAQREAWEEGYAEGYDDREKMDHGRADVIKAENPYPAAEEGT